MESNILLTPPAIEPVALDSFKAHAKIAHANEDDLLLSLLYAARQWVEGYTKRCLITQSWSLYFSSHPQDYNIVLPAAPLRAVTAVTYYDERDQETLWEDENYYVDTARAPGRLVLRDGAVWPNFTRLCNGLRITYVAGYGDAGTDVPEPIRLAIMQLALHWYEYRGEALAADKVTRVPLTIEALLQPYRLLSVR